MSHTLWRPSATIEALKARAHILTKIRQFFTARQVMEVETPVLASTSVTDPHIESIPVIVQAHPLAEEVKYYLQTSPEYMMKRLLAAGCFRGINVKKSLK